MFKKRTVNNTAGRSKLVQRSLTGLLVCGWQPDVGHVGGALNLLINAPASS